MHYLPFFGRIRLQAYQGAIKRYCTTVGYSGFEFTDKEVEQLSWYMESKIVTPEERSDDIYSKLHFEIKRGLARCYSFVLLLRGDEKSYKEFIKDQNPSTSLSIDDFMQLSLEANSLSPDIQTAIRVSCFLTITEQATELLKSNNFIISNDSEEFLSQVSVILLKHNNLFPLTENVSEPALKLLTKIFWPSMHLRHMLYTEGGITMTKTFVEGIKNKSFSQLDFLAWKWRWLTNIFAFHGGPTAKYYDAETHCLVSTVTSELEKMFSDSDYCYLDNYLLERAQMAGLNKEGLTLTASEQQLLGHLAAYFHRINILNSELGVAIYKGYIAFKKEFDNDGRLATLYQEHRQDEMTVTPTYVPAIINNAYCIFDEKFHDRPHGAIKQATQLMCSVLLDLYALPRHTRISCMNLSKMDVLQKIVEDWMIDHNSYSFTLEGTNLTAKPNELRLKLSLS